MKTASLVLISLNLGWIILQDFKERKVSLFAFISLLAFCIANYWLANTFNGLPIRILVNSLFACIILVFGTLLVKLKRPEDSVSSFIGTGDFLFLFAISPMFSFDAYLVFLNTSIILILLCFGLYLVLIKPKPKVSIPLAGALAISLNVLLLLDKIFPYNLLNDITWIYSLL